MDHEPVLISTLAVGLVAAFIGGIVAQRLKLPPIVGYIVAGIVIGPFTPGLMADAAVATELAEIGIILLMFGVGIHFSFRDLLAVKTIAVPGAARPDRRGDRRWGRVSVSRSAGASAARSCSACRSRWRARSCCCAPSSTARSSRPPRVGSPSAGSSSRTCSRSSSSSCCPRSPRPSAARATPSTRPRPPVIAIALALGKAALFVALMVVGGARLVPRLLMIVAREGSRELFTLAVLAIALGLAFLSAEVFGVSLALGAFLAGAIVSESDMSHQAAADALPMRDAFAVLFFVSVGMLLDPSYLVSPPARDRGPPRASSSSSSRSSRSRWSRPSAIPSASA